MTDWNDYKEVKEISGMLKCSLYNLVVITQCEFLFCQTSY